MLALLEHVLVARTGLRPPNDRGVRYGVSAGVTSEQAAARELVRDWAAGSAVIAAGRDVEHGEPDAWRPVYAGLAELGLFRVAVAEEDGGAGAAVTDLCAMVDEAAAALVPGPVASSALATLVLDALTCWRR